MSEKRIYSVSIFAHNTGEVAKNLIGMTMVVGKLDAVILEAKGYSRSDNEKDGLYRPLLDMNPGEVFIPPRRRGVSLILIATHDRGRPGGCVLIRAGEINGAVFDGPGKLSRALGINMPAEGTTEWLDEDRFRLVLRGVTLVPELKPARHKKRELSEANGNGIGKETIRKHIQQIARRYLKERPAGVDFADYINALSAQCMSAKEFASMLRR
ncbi:MAG: DNA-3-methyladenine glycosylase [bacterium]|nr:DNA-3-methyladenine glycosylase [bacterium]